MLYIRWKWKYNNKWNKKNEVLAKQRGNCEIYEQILLTFCLHQYGLFLKFQTSLKACWLFVNIVPELFDRIAFDLFDCRAFSEQSCLHILWIPRPVNRL